LMSDLKSKGFGNNLSVSYNMSNYMKFGTNAILTI
jgi:hypothetical protein